MAPVLGIWASSFNSRTFQPTGSYDALATYTVPSGGVSSITFSLAGLTGYSHLQLRYLSKNTAAGTDAYIQFNSQTNSVYRHQLLGNGSSASGSANSGIAYILLTSGSSGTSMFGAGIVDILDYASTSKAKTVRSLSGYDLNGSGIVGLGSALWTSTSAITDMTIVSAGTNLAEFSQFALYGVK